MTVYSLTGESEILTASAIDKGELQLWINSYPEGGGRQYLAGGSTDNARYLPNRVALLQAITNRLIFLYELWYNELRLGHISKAGSEP